MNHTHLGRAVLGVFGLTVLLPLLSIVSAQAPVPAPKPPDTFVNARGGEYRLPAPKDCKALVLIFVSHDCPIANSYAPEINRLCKQYAPRGVAFCVVYAEADLKLDNAKKHVAEFGYPCPAVLDPKLTLALQTGATVTPEAALLSPERKLLYRGRIDDTYPEYGKRRLQPTKTELRDAIEAVLAGRPVPVARTEAVGCFIDLPKK